MERRASDCPASDCPDDHLLSTLPRRLLISPSLPRHHQHALHKFASVRATAFTHSCLLCSICIPEPVACLAPDPGTHLTPLFLGVVIVTHSGGPLESTVSPPIIFAAALFTSLGHHSRFPCPTPVPRGCLDPESNLVPAPDSLQLPPPWRRRCTQFVGSRRFVDPNSFRPHPLAVVLDPSPGIHLPESDLLPACNPTCFSSGEDIVAEGMFSSRVARPSAL